LKYLHYFFESICVPDPHALAFNIGTKTFPMSRASESLENGHGEEVEEKGQEVSSLRRTAFAAETFTIPATKRQWRMTMAKKSKKKGKK